MPVQALSVGRVVNIAVNIGPIAASRANFGLLNVFGDSGIIDPAERYRLYTTIETVAADFGTDTPEYEAARLYFGQSPSPRLLMISCWIKEAVAATMRGAVLTAIEQQMTNWTSITAGEFNLVIDTGNGAGVETIPITGLDLSLQTNLNGVANIISTALTAHGASMIWDGDQFILSTTAKGAGVTLGYISTIASGTGQDISAMLKMTSATGLPPSNGQDAETPLEAVVAVANMSGAWYGCMFATTADISDEDNMAIAGFIEASSRARLFGVTVNDTRILESAYSADIASQFKAAKFNRAITQYASQTKFAVASLFGRAFTVNFNGNNTTITLKFKQEPGVTYEQLTETQAQALSGKNCNVFALYNNDTSIIQEGNVASGAFIDEIHGLDWLADAMQTELYNRLYTSTTKIPQTDEGVEILVAVCKGVCEEGVRNGLIGRNLKWNTDGFGNLKYGDMLPAGYYIYTIPIALQAQSEREQRRAPVLQIAVKLAGAFHFVDGIINVNR